MLADTRAPLPMEPQRPERVDYDYQREGVATLFMFCEPLAGRRQVTVTERRTRADWARAVKSVGGRAFSGGGA